MRTVHTTIERHGVPIRVNVEFTEFPYITIHSAEDDSGVDLYGILTSAEQDDLLAACEAATGTELYEMGPAFRWA